MSKSKHWSLLALFIKQVHRVSHFISDQSSKEKNINDLIQALLLRSPYYVNTLNLVIPQELIFANAANIKLRQRENIKTLYYQEVFEAPLANSHESTVGSLSDNDLNRIFLDTRGQLHQFLDRRVKCPEMAEDLTQEVYLRLPLMQKTIDSEAGVRAWLFRVATNLSIDHLRSQRRHSEILEQFFHPKIEIDQSPSLYKSVVDREQLQRVQDALEELPDQCADVLYMSRIEGLSHAAIALQLGISKSLIEKHIARALNHCRLVIDEDNE